jgi:hypothetical protein
MGVAGSLIESPEPSSLGQVCRVIFVDAASLRMVQSLALGLGQVGRSVSMQAGYQGGPISIDALCASSWYATVAPSSTQGSL